MRAQWKGFLSFGGVSCPVSLYTASSTSERLSFATVNRKTGNRVRREYVDVDTGKTVEREAQVKGYEIDNGQYVILTPEEVAAAVPDSDKTMRVEAYVDCKSIDDVYFDKPYYLTPSDRTALDAFLAIRDGMREAKVAAIAKVTLFRRARIVLIRAHGKGLIATTLNFDYEVRHAAKVFEGVPELSIKGEMLDLAKHIIATKKGNFDPAEFRDRYEAALGDLVKTKLQGRSLPKRKAPVASRPNDLLAALRMSAGVGSIKEAPAAANANAGARRQKPAARTSETGASRRKAG